MQRTEKCEYILTQSKTKTGLKIISFYKMWTKTPMKEENTVIFLNTKDSETLLLFINVHMAYQEIIPAWKCVSGTTSKFTKGKLKYLVKKILMQEDRLRAG